VIVVVVLVAMFSVFLLRRHCERSEAISRQVRSARRDCFVTFGSSQ